MKKRFLPISLLLTIIILSQTSFVVNANDDSGKYIPRTEAQPTAQSFMKSIRANQETGLIDPAWLMAPESQKTRTSNELEWTSLGPDNYGSLTRGIVYDKNYATNKTIYIGTMGGGVFQSVNGGITWKTISDNLMVSCMTQTEDGTIYIGTGDGRSAHDYNGLNELNYETSFIGSGLYKLGSNEAIDGTTDWKFINDIAAYKNDIYAATSEGLYHYNGKDAPVAIIDTIAAYGVEVSPDGTILAVLGNDVCIIKDGNCKVITDDQLLPSGTTYKIIAVSPSDKNYMYVSYLSNSNGTGNIYVTSNGGEEWQEAYTSTALYDIFGKRGLIDNAIAVYPNNPKKLLIGGLNLWVMKDDIGEGIYRLECISDGNGFQISQSGGASFYNYNYIHTGIQSIVFNPENENEFMVGSEGGIFKGTYNSNNGYLFEGANRYFETEENHTSVARMFSVAHSDRNNMVIGGSLDHGTINIYGIENTNNITTGSAIYPNDIATTDAAITYGPFDFTKAGGPCAISTIDPNIMFVTTTGSNSIGTPIFRTQTAGFDYDKENFTYSATDNSASIQNSKAFRTPIAFLEKYNDTKSVDSVKYYAKQDFKAGDTISDIKSSNGSYPFKYKLTQDLKNGDSIMVQDIISSTLLIGIEGKVYMTRSALKFSEKINWWLISTISGIPNAITLSTDGNTAYVGTLAGKLYRIEGLNDAVTKDLATVDSVKVIQSTELDGTAFNNRAITSIAVSPYDANEILVTLGNYGNDDYVFSSTDGGETFTSAQGDLPKHPAYSSLIVKTKDGSDMYLIGTEKGLYSSTDLSSWVADATIKNVPVMDIKQQTQNNRKNEYIYLVDEVGDITAIEYSGIENSGVIYIATYGRGLYKCEKYWNNVSENVMENTTINKSLNVNVYPNPIVNEATINFNVEEPTIVTYQIYDMAGRMVQNATLGNYTEGNHNANFNVNNLTSGSYIIRVQAGKTFNTAKILVY